MLNSSGKGIKNVLFFMVAVLVMAVFKVTASFSITLVLSLFIFLLMLPLVSGLERIKVPRVIATIVAILILVIVILVASWFLVYSLDVLVRTLPGYVSKMDALDSFALSIISRWVEIPENYSFIRLLDIDWIGGVIMPLLKTTSGSMVTIVKNALMTVLFTTFLLLERHTIIPKIQKMTKPENSEKVLVIWDRLNHQISKYLTLKLIISFITGLCFYLICYIEKIDFALILGALAFIMNFVPTFGSIIVTALTILIAVLQCLPNWSVILIVAIGTITTQMVLGNIIEPRLQGNQLNLSPFVILVSLSLFGYIWGIVGMFLAVPLLSVLQIIFANVDSTKPLAILLSSGSSLKRKIKSENKVANEKSDEKKDSDSVLMPS